MTPAELLTTAKVQLQEGDAKLARAYAEVAIAEVLVERFGAPPETDIPAGATPVKIDPVELTLIAFREWLNDPDIPATPCTCGHRLRVHFADLSGCPACDQEVSMLDRVDSDTCRGFTLDRSAR